MAYGISLRSAAFAIAIMGSGLVCEPCQAQWAQIRQLDDVAFGQVNTLGDLSQAQSVSLCSTTGQYRVRASGSGAGGAFLLSSGSSTLPYSVQWAGTAGQTSGTALQANVNSPEFSTTLSNLFACWLSQPLTASLIIGLTGTDTANARAGNYSGTLTLLIVPS